MATSSAPWTSGAAVFAASMAHRDTRVRAASSSGRATARPSATARLGRGRRGNVVRTAAADPTFDVPRAEGVQDGEWNELDERLVRESQGDAEVTFARSTSTKDIERLLKGDGAKKDLKGVDPTYNLLGMTLPELKDFAKEAGLPAFRGKQLRDHLYGVNPVKAIEDCSTLPKAARQQLIDAGVVVGRSAVHQVAASTDGTTKLLLRLHDDRVVETVGIPANEAGRKRLTACVSSQVGCPMRCTFCATGKGGFARNLATHEIVDQIVHLEEHFGERVTHVVFMGMGEPLLNVPNVLRAHEALNKEVGIGSRHITISTVGVRGAIERLARAKLQSTLAISLHAPNQALREELIPSAKAYPMQELLNDAQQYFIATGRRVTFEYTLLAGVNDSIAQAEELGRLLYKNKLASHVNIIPYNPVDEADFQRPGRASIMNFKNTLEDMNVPASIRQSRGLEAAAACGQLRNAYQKNALQAEEA